MLKSDIIRDLKTLHQEVDHLKNIINCMIDELEEDHVIDDLVDEKEKA